MTPTESILGVTTTVGGPDPDNPGWLLCPPREPGRFKDNFGKIVARLGDDGFGYVRLLEPERRHSNPRDAIHGGALMAFIDLALFTGAQVCGVAGMVGAQTMDCNIQFIARAMIGKPLDARIEVLRETGQFVFIRGLLLQDDATVTAFSAKVRKPTRKP